MIKKWKVSTFDDLSKTELHNLLILRQEVFIVEQNCPYQDADKKDFNSHHLMGYDQNNQLIAYLRIVGPGVSYKEVSLGRILTHISHRGTGLGKETVKMGIQFTESIYGKVVIKISAQSHLASFYKFFDFESTGKEYLEDDIPHTEMIRH